MELHACHCHRVKPSSDICRRPRPSDNAARPGATASRTPQGPTTTQPVRSRAGRLSGARRPDRLGHAHHRPGRWRRWSPVPAWAARPPRPHPGLAGSPRSPSSATPATTSPSSGCGSPRPRPVLYTLGGGVDEAQGWGRADETHASRRSWPRTASSRSGSASATATSAPTWPARCGSARGSAVAGDRPARAALGPARARGQAAADDGHPGRDARRRRGRAGPAGRALPGVVGADARRRPRAAVRRRRDGARHPRPGSARGDPRGRLVVLPPSNPVVSIGIILGVPGVRDALRGSRAPVVGVSPIISGPRSAGTPTRAWPRSAWRHRGGRGRALRRLPRRLAGREEDDCAGSCGAPAVARPAPADEQP